MLFGDPYKFALGFDVVPNWSDSAIHNGLFYYYMDGLLVPQETYTASIGTNVMNLRNLDCMNLSLESKELFSLPLKELYCRLHQRAFPVSESDVDKSDYSHLISTESLLDQDHIFFLVNWEKMSKVIYGRWLDVGSFREATFSRGTFEAAAKDLISNWDQFLMRENPKQ